MGSPRRIDGPRKWGPFAPIEWFVLIGITICAITIFIDSYNKASR